MTQTAEQLDMFNIPEEPDLNKRQADRWAAELVGALADPIIIHKSPWAESHPPWIRDQIIMDRLILLMQTRGQAETATDAEAMAYLYPATMDAPLRHHWAQIYLYVCTKTMTSAGKTIPADIRVDTLDQDEMRELNRLKNHIYRKRRAIRPKMAKPSGTVKDNVAPITETRQYVQAELF